jgi:hypothetical protein
MLRHFLVHFGIGENLLQLARNLREFLDEGAGAFRVERTSYLSHIHAEDKKSGDLRRECFRRSNADLGPSVSQQCSTGFARDHGPDYVADGERLRAFVLRLAKRSQRVGRFARLRDDNRQGIGRDDGIAVAEFTAVIDFNGKPRQPFDDEFTGQAGVPTGSARDDFDLLKLTEISFRNVDFVEEYTATLLPNAADECVFNRTRLLKNFFEHEVLVAALFR